MTSHKPTSDVVLANKLREALRAAADYERRLTERGYKTLISMHTADDGGREYCVDIERRRIETL